MIRNMTGRRNRDSPHGIHALLLSALIVAGPAAAHLLGQSALTLTDLGTLGGEESEAAAINGLGEVVGWSTTADGATHAFLHRGGVLIDLGTLPGGTLSRATGINDAGQIVGLSGINEYGVEFQEFPRAFLWQDGVMQALGALYCPCSFNERYGTSAAYSVGANGRVVGDSETVRGEAVRHAFLWEDGVMQDVGGGEGGPSISAAYGVNAAGDVVGAFDGRAFIWRDGVTRDLGTLPGHASSAARAINALGQIAGESVAAEGEAGSVAADGPPRRAVLWENGVIRDLGTLPGDRSSRARGINGSAQVVGDSTPEGGLVSRAVVWQNGVAYDLNALVPADSGWLLTSAAAINDAGEIAGTGLRHGRRRAFLLTPGTRPGAWGATSGQPRIKR